MSRHLHLLTGFIVGLICAGLFGGILIPSAHAQEHSGKVLTLKGMITDTGELHRLAHTGDVLAGGGYFNDKMQFFDISDPTNPELSYSYPISEHFFAIVTYGKYIYGSHYKYYPRRGWVDIFDVTDPAAPARVCEYTETTAIGGIDLISPTQLLLANDDYGISILDVSNFDKPAVIDTQHQANAQEVHIVGNIAAIGDSTIDRNRVYLYDISSKTNIGYISSIMIPGKMQDLEYDGSTVYVAGNSAGVVIVDVSDPYHPVVNNPINGIGDVWDVKVAGTMLFVASGEYFSIYDVTNPASPRRLYRCATDGAAKGLALKDSLIYVGTDDSLQVFALEDETVSLTYLTAAPYSAGSKLTVYWSSNLERSGSSVKFELWNNTGRVADLGYCWNVQGRDVVDLDLPVVPAGKYWIRVSSTWDPGFYACGIPFELQAYNAVPEGYWLGYE